MHMEGQQSRTAWGSLCRQRRLLAGRRWNHAQRRIVFAALALWPFACLAGSQPSGDEACPVVPQRSEPALEVAHLRDLCAPLWERLSNDCMAALDGIYLYRDVTRNWHSEPLEDPADGDEGPWAPLPFSDRIVWRDVFDDPMGLRMAVEDAMTEPQCRAMRDDAPHALREVCAADAFARLSVLHRACGRTLYWDGSTYHDGWAAEWKLEREYLAEDAHGLDHAQRVARLDESELHFAWRLAKCRTVPTAAMERVIGLHAPHHRLNIQDTELLVVAARLGSVWANTQIGGDDAELDAAATANVALADLRRAVGAALGNDDSPQMYLPYLLAAREHDLRTGALLDWSELEQRFSEAALSHAQPALDRLLREGWQAMQEGPITDTTWPWAIVPPVVDTRYIHRQLDSRGNERWQYEDGTEEWIDRAGKHHLRDPDSDETITMYHGPLQDRRQPSLRSWLDENGRQRWLDVDGVEHWIDADDAEHWIDFSGTEWILLPLGTPFPKEAE